MEDRKIKSIIVDGWDRLIVSTEDEPISLVWENGEMAAVAWYKKGDTEYNGKYVVAINYEKVGSDV
jgi:hypothetical protein